MCRPLHLAIIHENTNLTQYLVKLIVGVYMNLDIANNMRQVWYACGFFFLFQLACLLMLMG